MFCRKLAPRVLPRRAPQIALLALALAVTTALSPSAQAATDNHAFPRTFTQWDGWIGAERLARHDMVVGFANYDIAAMRAVNPDGVFLMHPGLNPTGYGDYGVLHVTAGPYSQWTGGCDTESDGQAANVGCLRAFEPYWDLLHNADGSLAEVAGPGPNLADPTGRGTPELVAKIIALSAKKGRLYRDGWDGVFSDNWIHTAIGDGWFFGPNLDTDRNGQVDDYTVMRRNWMNGLTDVGNRLRTYLPGKIVGGNGSWFSPERYSGSDPDGWLKSSNLTEVEYLEQFYNRADEFVALARRWIDYPDPYGQPRYLLARHYAQTGDGSSLQIPAGASTESYMLDAGVMRSMRWGLTLSLMGDAYYEFIPAWHDAAEWWYDEYDGGDGVRRRGYLGRPLGPAQKLPNGVWRRDFENGIALNNSTSAPASVLLETSYRHLSGPQNPQLNSGALTGAVSVAGKDGVIMLRIVPIAAPPAPAPTPAPQPVVAPANTGLPTVSGTARSGETLTASDGTWSGATPMTFAYQWLRCDVSGTQCADIAGATGRTYQLVDADVASTIRVVVMATNAGGLASATSDPTGAVAAGLSAPVETSLPTIAGTARMNERLTARSGAWSGTEPITLAYQWNRCTVAGTDCEAISGADDRTYRIRSRDIGMTLRVVVTARNAAGQRSATSEPTAMVEHRRKRESLRILGKRSLTQKLARRARSRR